MIYLTKLSERIFKDTDIYILKKLGSSILINDEYKGLMILDLNLSIINTINLNQEYCISYVFVNDLSNQILLYCADDNVLTYYNFLTGIKKNLINFKAKAMSQLYQWKDNIALFYYSGSFHRLYTDSFELNKINRTVIKNHYSEFYRFYMFEKNYPTIYQINVSDYSFISNDEDEKTITFVDYLNKKNIVSQYYPPEPYEIIDILFEDNFFVFIREDFITISYGEYLFKLYPDYPYEFLRAFFTKQGDKLILVVLAANKSGYHFDKILIFNVELVINHNSSEDNKFNSLTL